MKTLWKALSLSLVLLVLCGLIYPLGMTAISQLLFPNQANGSIIRYNGKPAGSKLFGQSFTDPRFFHGRVSSVNYNTYRKEDTLPDQSGKIVYTGVSSGSANLAPSNPALAERVRKDIDEFLKTHPEVKREDLPADLFTSSGSGLDPHLSPAAAWIQIPGVAKATGINERELAEIVRRQTKGRFLGIFGEPRVNILLVNLEIAKRLNL